MGRSPAHLTEGLTGLMATRTAENATNDAEQAPEVQLGKRLLTAAGIFVIAAIPVTLVGFAVARGSGAIHDFDQDVANSLHDWAVDRPGAVTFLKVLSDVIDPWALRAVAAVVVVTLFLRGRRRRLRAAGG